MKTDKIEFIDLYDIHYTVQGNTGYFKVYKAFSFNEYDITDRDYEDSKSSDYIQFDPDRVIPKLEGNLCNKGSWVGRLSFPDKDYWTEELKELSDLYTNHIEPYLKSVL